MTARLGIVIWKDAALYFQNAEPEMVDCFTAGWIYKNKNCYVVINHFSGGEPDTFFVIPKQWAMKVVYVGNSRRQINKIKW